MSKLTDLDSYRKHLQRLRTRKDNSLAEPSLEIWQHEAKKLACYYAPFDHVNLQAAIIIVGITPGRTQMNRSINAFKQALKEGQDIGSALKSVKQHASLSGSMRPRIIEMLNKLGYAKQLGIKCCSSLWAEHAHLVHFCSVLKYPIFVNGKDYCGQPKLFNTPALRHLLLQEFVHDLSSINPKAMIVPLGEMVAEVLTTLHQQGHIPQRLTTFENRVVAPPHPSGANAESIALLLKDEYPSLIDYQDAMYQQYLNRQSWLKKPDGQPQNETKYKKARTARWYAMSHVRQAYKL